MFNNANICLKVLNLTYKTFLFLDNDGDKDGNLLTIFLFHKICYILATYIKGVIFCLLIYCFVFKLNSGYTLLYNLTFSNKKLQTFYTIPVQNLSFVLGEKEPSNVKRGKATD